jgi:peptidyl-prolyl cis-trans isomerase SurA
MIALFCFLISFNAFSEEKLLDKIIAVINTRVVSLSEVERIKETLPARQEIAPFIYNVNNNSSDSILSSVINNQIIRDKISAQGYVISDDHVESRIKQTEEKLGLNRASLLAFLKTKSITYEEYFEIIRESMEYNIFATRIIAPLITITDQELKNEFYKRNTDNKALSFTYDLVDFSIQDTNSTKEKMDFFLASLKDYQISGRLPPEFSNVEINDLEKIKGDAVSIEISKVLEQSLEGNFSKPAVFGGKVHVFFIKSKNLVESQTFLNAKDRIQDEIFTSKSISLTKNWFDREYANYYIKRFL